MSFLRVDSDTSSAKRSGARGTTYAPASGARVIALRCVARLVVKRQSYTMVDVVAARTLGHSLVLTKDKIGRTRDLSV